MELYRSEQNLVGEASTFANLGALFLIEKKYIIASENLEQSKDLLLKEGNIRSLASVYDNLGQLARINGEEDKALVNYEAALNYARKERILPVIKQASFNLFQIYEGLDSLRVALEMHKLYTDASAQINNDDHERDLIRISFDLQTESQNNLARFDILKERCIIVGAGLLLAPVLY